MQVSEKSYNPTESTCRLGENEVIHNNQISLIGFTIKGFKLSYYHNDKNQQQQPPHNNGHMSYTFDHHRASQAPSSNQGPTSDGRGGRVHFG